MTDTTTFFKSIKRLWDEFIKGLPGFTVIGFGLVLIFLSMVFGEWGLSPMQLVAPVDTVVPGILVGFLFGAINAMPWVVANLADGLVVGRARRIWSVILMLGAVIFTVIGFVGGLGVTTSLLAFFLAACCALRLLLDVAATKPSSTMIKVGVLLLAVCASGWGVVAPNGVLNLIVREGFVRGLLSDETTGAPCNGTVLWLGEKAIVIRCGPDDIRVMTPKEGLQFRRPSASAKANGAAS